MPHYNNYDPEKQYEVQLYQPDRILQSNEMNGLQKQQNERLRRVAEVLFNEGAIIAAAGCTVNTATGAATLDAGALFIDGAVRDVTAQSFNVPLEGTVTVGVYLTSRIVTAVEDPALYNPAVGTRGYGEPGADRLQVLIKWGIEGKTGQGRYYPVWTIINGIVQPREPAPQLHAITQAIARYDRDSAGGTYVVRGMGVSMLENDAEDRQVFTVAAGAARINGNAQEYPSDRRIVFDAKPDLDAVQSESHSITNGVSQVLRFNRWPVLKPATVRVTRRHKETITHGAFAGVADPLPHNAVIQIERVEQGATVYERDTSWIFEAGQVDWSPAGPEPIPGSAYDVTYLRISTEPAQNQNTRSLEVSGVVPGTVALIDYEYAMRRIDTIVISESGEFNVFKGIPAPWTPRPVEITGGNLGLASIYQLWTDQRRIEQTAVRVVAMDELQEYRQDINGIKLDLAELRLATDIAGRYSGIKKGYFADPLRDNSMRDQGIEQTAMIEGESLQLFTKQSAVALPEGARGFQMNGADRVAISQVQHSRAWKIVAGESGSLPATMSVSPAIHRWEEPQIQVYPTVTLKVGTAYAIRIDETPDSYVSKLKDDIVDKSKVFIQEIDLTCIVHGLQPFEDVESVTFDGVTVLPTPLEGGSLSAGPAGQIGFKIRVPAKTPVGIKTISTNGALGSVATALFIGTGTVKMQIEMKQWAGYEPPGSYTPFFVTHKRELTYVV